MQLPGRLQESRINVCKFHSRRLEAWRGQPTRPTMGVVCRGQQATGAACHVIEYAFLKYESSNGMYVH